jgi:hypothetical protein
VPISEIERRWYPLSLEELRAHLSEGRTLPKDGFVTTDVAGLHSNSYRHRDRNFERSALHALAARGSSPKEQALALRIANCRRHERCGRITCYICNQRYWRKRRAVLERLSSDGDHDAISWCTVIIGHSQVGYPVISQGISDFKASFTSALSRFPQVKWSGRIEIDYLDQSISPLKPEKFKTLTAMHWDPSVEIATLLPHAHLVVVHPDVRREILTYHIKRPYPESRRVQMRPFRITRDREASLNSLVRYPLKRPLDAVYLAGRNSKNHIPRHPKVVRYVMRMREALDRPTRRGQLEFDHI